MKKSDVIAAVAEATEQSKVQVEKTLDGFVTLLAKAVADGAEVSYPNLGKFQLKEQAARQARNPHTGETIDVPSKKVVKFTMSKSLKEAAVSSAAT
jgi:DNA-binding protein HU-beta